MSTVINIRWSSQFVHTEHIHRTETQGNVTAAIQKTERLLVLGQVLFLELLQVLWVTYKIHISALHFIPFYYRLIFKLASFVDTLCKWTIDWPPSSCCQKSEINLTYRMQ